MAESSEAGSEANAQGRRAPARPADIPQARRSRVPAMILVLVAFVCGGAVGVQVMRVRHHRYDFQAVVAVNGTVIDKQQLVDRVLKQSGTQVIRVMVGEELTRQFAKKSGTMPTDAEVEKRYATASKQDGFKENMARNGDTPEKVKERMRDAMARERIVNKGVTVTDAEVRKFYESNVDPKNPLALFYVPDQVQIAVIVTATEANAKKALSEMNSGIPWATVVKKYSQDGSKQNSGVLPPTLRGRTRSKDVPGLEDAIFGMKIGETIGPRSFAKAWWIIRCLDKKLSQKKTFEQVKEQAKTGAELVKGIPANSKKVQQQFEDFQKKANLQAFWPQFKDVIKVQ